MAQYLCHFIVIFITQTAPYEENNRLPRSAGCRIGCSL